MSNNTLKFLLASTAIATLVGSGAAATLSAVIPIELQWDSAYETDAGDDFSDFYATIEPDITVTFNDFVSFNVGLTLEPVTDVLPGEDRFLSDHGLFVRDLFVQLNFDHSVWRIGKFTPRFGIGYDEAPGVFNDTFNADVELAERLGVEAAFTLTEGDTNSITLTAALFFRDTTFLSDSALTSRGDLDETDGGPGNTESFENFSLALDVANAFGTEGLNLHAAIAHQSAGLFDLEDQLAFVIAGTYAREYESGFGFSLIAEWAHSDDAWGFGDAFSLPGGAQDIATLGLGLSQGPWNGAITWGLRDNDFGGGSFDENFIQFSAGYTLDCGLEIALAHQSYEDDFGFEEQTFAVFLGYEVTLGAEE